LILIKLLNNPKIIPIKCKEAAIMYYEAASLLSVKFLK